RRNPQPHVEKLAISTSGVENHKQQLVFEKRGLPAPSFQPRLKGRNHEFLPFRCVQNRTYRPNSKTFSRGSRSRLYCSTASSTVCFVRLFFSSKVAIGRPLMKIPRSSARCVSSRLYRSCLVTEKRFCAKRSAATALPGEGFP